MLQGMRNNEANDQVGNLARQAEDLARRQQEFEGQMRKAFGPQSAGITREQAEQLAGQKEAEIKQLKSIEQGMQTAVRDLQSTQRKAARRPTRCRGGAR